MKHLKLIAIILFTSLLTGCVFNDPKYINLKDKPNLYYYSNEVYKNLKNNKDFTIKVFDYNLYKYYEVPEKDYNILLSFFQSLTNDNYTSEAPEHEEIPYYKIIVEFNDSNKLKYVIDVYNNNFVTLFPWDGVFEEDNITMDGVPKYDNLYDFCVYVTTRR